ncbi:MAG: cohesin domain-containing protein [Thermodesulfobacteriota bacterium]
MMKRFLAIIVLGIALLATGAAGASTLSLDPVLSETVVGGPVDFSVHIAGLGTGLPPSLGAFSFRLVYDPALLAFDSVVFGSALGDPGLGESLQLVDASLPGSVLAESLSLLSPAELDLGQPGAFTLASLRFLGLTPGFGEVHLAGLLLSDGWGCTLQPTVHGISFVAVDPVPVPATVWLLGAVLPGLACLRRRAAA